jgi:hypothetical protein
MTLHENTLPGTTVEALEKLGTSDLLKTAYLAGGTAVALQLGHRISHDLDFFTPELFDEKIVGPQFEEFGLEPAPFKRRTIIGKYHGVSFSYFYYKYPLLFPTIPFRGIALADLRDLAAMKLDAIATRGTERDFVDLYMIMKQLKLTLLEVASFYQQRNAVRPDTLIHVVKSVTNFAEAEAEQDRALEPLVPIDWEAVKAFFREAAAKESKMILEDAD